MAGVPKVPAKQATRSADRAGNALGLPANLAGARARLSPSNPKLPDAPDILWSVNDIKALGLTPLQRHHKLQPEAETIDFKLTADDFAKNKGLVDTLQQAITKGIKPQGRDDRAPLESLFKPATIVDGAALYDNPSGKLRGLWVKLHVERNDGGQTLRYEALLKPEGKLVRLGTPDRPRFPEEDAFARK